jgi:toxin YoeB
MARDVKMTPVAMEDFLYWQANDKSCFRKIAQFIKEGQREDGRGTGKAELLKGDLSGWSSKRINQEHRFIYKIENDVLIVLRCRDHYK